MSNQNINLSDTLYQYMLSISLREPAILKSLRETTHQLSSHSMQISPEQGQLMGFLIELTSAVKTLEIGVYTGYSALVVALALPEIGKIIACDINKETTSMALDFWRKAGIAHKIDLKLAPALETLDNLIKQDHSNSFDFIFIDADKQNYLNYYARSLTLLRPGGLMLVDNVLWSGRVADTQAHDKQTLAIRTFNQAIYLDKRISVCLIPIGDGLTLIRKR
ncbi:MAG: class I SAM-dependent methyltransferase [Candidatus Rickettsiella isopodorum]|nr:class I SAM-dependent methyltransferase [Gammaproteobacteria bacterium]